MKDKNHTPKQGQAIVIMAFAIIALAALVGLAIDGGNLYTLRRRAQITADSTAMAGTQMLADLISQCATPSAAHDNAIRDQILEYARLNGVDAFSPDGEVTAWYVNGGGHELGFVGSGSPIPTGATGIRTSIVTTDTTTFMRLFGFRHIAAPGGAMALAGRVTQMGGGGLLPIAVWDEVVKHIGYGEEFHIQAKGEFKDFCTVICPDCCQGQAGSASQRGWLQLGHIYNNDPSIMNRAFTTNMSASSLRQYINPATPYPHNIYAGDPGIDNGDFIVGNNGSMSSATQDVVTYWLGQVVFLPVFDLVYTGDHGSPPTMQSIFSPNRPQPVNSWVSGSSRYYYHVTGFVAAELIRHEGSWGSGALVGEFRHASIQAGQINPGAGIGSGSACTPGLVGFTLVD